MAVRSGGCIRSWLLLLLLPTLLLAQDNYSHNCKNEANRYYYVRPEGSAETLCPAQPCLTPSQLREHFSECERNNSCQTATTSLVLLPGNYTSDPNGSFIPNLTFLCLTGNNEDYNTDSLPTPSIDCNGFWISLMFQHIECLHVRNCIVFTGYNTAVAVDRVTFNDTLIRLASITAADHSELDYNYALGSKDYCLLQKQLGDTNASTPGNSHLALTNVSFSSDYHTKCALIYGIELATIHATDSTLNITDCLFTQNSVTHISLLYSTLNISGIVQFENANTAIVVNSSTVALAGVVKFFNSKMSAIIALNTQSMILLAGTVEFTNNTARRGSGGAVSMEGGSMTITDKARVVFQGNHAKYFGGAINFSQHDVTIAGSVNFTNNSASNGGAISGNVAIYIVDNAQVKFQANHAMVHGGAIAITQQITIAGSVQFINNSASYGGAIFSDGNVTIAANCHVLFQGNHGKITGGVIFSSQQSIPSDSAQFINNSSHYKIGTIETDGSATVADNTQGFVQGRLANTLSGASITTYNQRVTIAGSVKFINNSADRGSGGAIHSPNIVTITDTAHVVFQGNYAKNFGGAIDSFQHVAIAGSVQFTNNSAIQGGAIASDGAVSIFDSAHLVFTANHADSQGGAIATNSIVLLAGNVTFISNTAQLGGAISTLPGKVTVANNALVCFQGNHAYDVGGAIYSSSTAFFNYLMLIQPCLISFGVNSTVDLLNNTAENGGSATFGISMSKFNCHNIPIFKHGDYEYLFNIITIIPDNFSAVSSKPLRVCICPYQSTPDCLAILPDQNISHLHYTIYPGQNFTIPAVVVGFNFALISGSVYAQFLSSEASLGSESQYVQAVSHNGCSQLQYIVLSDKKQETLVLATKRRQVGGIDKSIKEDIRIQNNNNNTYNDSPFRNPNKYYVNNTFLTNQTDGVFRLAGYVQESLQTTPVYVSVHLLDCPLGFTLTGQHRCDCNERILTNLLSCSINNQTVRRHGNIWVNATFNGNTSNGVIVHKHCPFEYCKPEQIDVNLTHPETQCAFDHYGTLCGACKPNFSLALGGSQCLPNCSNKYLLLVIGFIIAGFVLVFFIKILNLTVSQGTINGLIFYANIIAANRSIFFPAKHSNILSFLSVFISWLNLDLGIETCFIKGLDGYWKTWLQFVFPFYVWLIAGAIILVSRYSTRATIIFGDKSVSVLATLILLSYAKLLRSIINIFSFTTLEYPDNVTTNVWSYDGNLQYLSSKHIPLFLFALITLLLLWLPYTAVLLCAQWLRTQTHRKRLHWLKPFLDAYYGPFKDNHHYWVGVLLVVRGVLFAFFASFFAIQNNVNILLISITSLAIPIYTSFTGSLYKNMFPTILENASFLNLGILGIGALYIRLVGGNQEALVTTSVGIAFLEFCGITIFHSYQFVIIPIQHWFVRVRANSRSNNSTVQLPPLPNSDSTSEEDSLEYMPRNEVTHSDFQLCEEQDPPNPISSAEYQLPPADMTSIAHSEKILIPFNCDTEGPGPNIDPIMLTDAAANQTAGAPSQLEAATVSLDEPPHLQLSSERPRYFAVEREERFIDFNAPRETLLEYTQYRLPQERNEPARDSTAERELLSAPHEHPQESSEPRYFAAEREGPIDFTAPRESLLDYTQ